LWPGDEGKEVKALQDTLRELGYLQPERPNRFLIREGGKFLEETIGALKKFQAQYSLCQHGMYDNDTRDSLVSLVDSLNTTTENDKPPATEPQPQAEPTPHAEIPRGMDQVALIDTDGDKIVFVLSTDGKKLSEYVNGALEIDAVSWLVIDLEASKVRDQMGSFSVEPSSENIAGLFKLSDFAKCADVTVSDKYETLAQRRGVEAKVDIDIDLSDPSAQSKMRADAEGAIASACRSMGRDPKDAFKALSTLFSGLQQAGLDAAGDDAGNSSCDEYVDVLKEFADEAMGTEAAAASSTEGAVAGKSDEAAAGQYDEQLGMILSMGVCNEDSAEEVLQLLKQFEGDADKVVNKLISSV
jgi:hypothetical protein